MAFRYLQSPLKACCPVLLISAFMGCQLEPRHQQVEPMLLQNETEESTADDMQLVKLGTDQTAFENIQKEFSSRNPGYQLDYLESITEVTAGDSPRVLFMQTGETKVQLSTGLTSEVTVGDIMLLMAGTGLRADSAVSLLQFTVPSGFPKNIPEVIRPDWDMNITDVPGGCATETNAYRRILLTWKQEVGEYLYHDLNAHRVRIMDSFSHYHPVEGGFDEFYLVQMALPEARIITSNQVGAIENPHAVAPEQVSGLLKSTKLEVGHLVYLPRGVMHRGLGGVLAQVITIPGFIPGSEIGVDHHLKTINENLELDQGHALPFNLEASAASVIK